MGSPSPIACWVSGVAVGVALGLVSGLALGALLALALRLHNERMRHWREVQLRHARRRAQP